VKTKVLVKGPCLTQSGYGEHARFVLRALRSREEEYDIYINPTTWGQTGWIHEDDEFRNWMDANIIRTRQLAERSGNRLEGLFDMSLQVTIPNEWEKLAPINIGVTAGIETTKVAPAWIQKANQVVDKIITISNHSKQVYEKTIYHAQTHDEKTFQVRLEKPIDIVHYPVREHGIDKDFNLSLDYDFNYLMVSQHGPRKNMYNAIKWWLEENWDEEVGLIVKTSKRKNCILDRQWMKIELKKMFDSVKLEQDERKCKLYLLHGDLQES